jgi:hypothetical protein
MLQNTSIKQNKYVVNKIFEHFDDISCRQLFDRIRVAKKKICPFQDKVAVSTLVILFYEKVWNKKKKDKRTNNDLQSTTHKAKYRVTRTPLNTRVNSYAPEG